MRFNFLLNDDISVGSDRVFGYLIKQNLSLIGYETAINAYVESHDVIILGKNFKLSDFYKLKNDKTPLLIGEVNPSFRSKEKRKKFKIADFLITGSLTEAINYVSLKNKSYYVMTLLESKKEFDKHLAVVNKIYTIGYHGNRKHIEQFPEEFLAALEEYAANVGEIRLRLFYNYHGKTALPRKLFGVQIEEIEWKYEEFHKQLKSHDVGFVPALSNWKHSKTLKFYEGDFNLKFKNNTNNGRLLSYVQAGVPVLADISPYHFILGDDGHAGEICATKDQYYRALVRMRDERFRTNIALTASDRLSHYLDERENAQRFANFCEQLIRR